MICGPQGWLQTDPRAGEPDAFKSDRNRRNGIDSMGDGEFDSTRDVAQLKKT